MAAQQSSVCYEASDEMTSRRRPFGQTISRSLSRIREIATKHRFAAHGENFRFDPNGLYSYENIHCGANVNLGYRPTILASNSRVFIGNNVIFGPNVTLVAGNHNTAVIGAFMSQVTEKRATDDLDITIEGDVWVGANAMLLSGVTIERGSVVAAMSVVTRDVPPYAVVAGNPARVLRFRWDPETIIEHEMLLYAPQDRIPLNSLIGHQSAIDGSQ